VAGAKWSHNNERCYVTSTPSVKHVPNVCEAPRGLTVNAASKRNKRCSGGHGGQPMEGQRKVVATRKNARNTQAPLTRLERATLKRQNVHPPGTRCYPAACHGEVRRPSAAPCAAPMSKTTYEEVRVRIPVGTPPHAK